MDLKDSSWYGRLTISGTTEQILFSGSIVTMNRSFIQSLLDARPRTLASGKRVTIEFSDRPFDLEPLNEIEMLTLDDAPPMGPTDGESFEEFYARKLSEGVNPVAALWQANDWFERPQDPQMVAWMTDPKIIRFNELNASKQAYESALPSEYEQLKQYIWAKYPERATHITFKTA